MQAGGLDVSLLKPTILILFSDRLHWDLCEMAGVTCQYQTSCSKDISKALEYGIGTGDFPEKLLPSDGKYICAISLAQVSSIMLRFAFK